MTQEEKKTARVGPPQILTEPVHASSDSESEPEDAPSGEQAPTDNFLADYPDDTEESHLQHSRLTNESLPPLDLPRFTELTRSCLRQNESSSPLPKECSKLGKSDELDSYDNRLGPVVEDEEVKGMPSMTSLDLSFNNIRHIPNLPSSTKVKVSYLIQNKIKAIEPGVLDWCKDTITSLELGGNRIRTIENIEMLTLLDESWLGKNKIRRLENLNAFANLKISSIQSNRITKMEGLEELKNLEELYSSHNGSTKIEGSENNTKLRTLDIGNNEITAIENVSHSKDLEEFWASYNKIESLANLHEELGGSPNLETVYLEGNPCQRNDMAGYRRKVVLASPQVQQIDATFVKHA